MVRITICFTIGKTLEFEGGKKMAKM